MAVSLDPIHLEALVRLLAALAAGGLVGFERSYHGRPAGFRTHTLVCMASSLLMLLTVYQIELLPGLPLEAVRIDPTRMAQGLMTGIGFLGAGVIIKERLTIRGLTTAASIWMTAAIGILIGIGFYFAAAVGTLLTLVALSLFRWVENVLPSLYYARLEVASPAGARLTLEELLALIAEHGCSAANPGYALEDEGRVFRYEITLRTRHRDNYRRLAEALAANPGRVSGFRIVPASE
jgi:putative Mg2+ transporter-C (MgtC) family protein